MGCSYNKVLKDGTPDQKLAAAKKYYNKGDYNRALPLLDALIGVRWSNAQAEENYYYFAYSHYNLGDYVMANYNFNNFVKNYPRSPLADECAFMAVKCVYHQTLPYHLDQTTTKLAIDQIQLFIIKHPGSKFINDGNVLIDELRTKLHNKAFDNAMLYYKMANYKSSLVSFKNAVADYPDIPQKEEIEFLAVKSAYLYAKQSFQSSQIERFGIAIEEGNLFLESDNTNESYRKEVKEMIEDSNKEIARIEKLKSASSAVNN